MEIRELGDLDLRPDRLTTRQVRVPDPARWWPDPRRASHVQEKSPGYLGDRQPAWLGFERSRELDPVGFTGAILGSADPHGTYLWINRAYEGICLSFRHTGTATARTAGDGYLNEVRSPADRISGLVQRLSGGRLTVAGPQSS